MQGIYLKKKRGPCPVMRIGERRKAQLAVSILMTECGTAPGAEGTLSPQPYL